MAEVVQREVFADRIGSTVEARLDAEQAVELRIDRVEDFGPADGTRFSVFLSGPGDRLLPQGIYTVAPPGGETFELFVVPVGREQDRYLYEAAFNREGG